MHGKHSTTAASTSPRPRTASPLSRVLLLIGGIAATFVFYAFAPRIPGAEAFVQRYFCGHPLEYVSTSLFFVAAALLLGKLIRLPREMRALRTAMTALSGRTSGHGPDMADVDRLQAEHSSVLRDTSLQARLIDAGRYLQGSGDDRFEDHLRYLADIAADRLHQSFAILRTIVWAIPIVGFLGTVIGITIAIANVTPQQLESSLPEVTAGLAVAFDTTAQALGMSIVLVLATFFVERGEQLILNDVERFGIDCLLPAAANAGLATSGSGPSATFRDRSQVLFEQQAELWTRQLQELRQEWRSSLFGQTEKLLNGLTSDTQNALAAWQDDVRAAGTDHRAVMHAEATALAEQLDDVVTRFTNRVDLWQQALQASSIAAAGQTEELHRIGRTLLRLAESEERLTVLQHQLNQNLESLQIVETLEQTLSGLNAAVNVLTTKSIRRAAA